MLKEFQTDYGSFWSNRTSSVSDFPQNCRDHNALYFAMRIDLVFDELSLQSVAAVLGNMYHESGINPCQINASDYGYGLSQWTPPTKLQNYVEKLIPAYPKFSFFNIDEQSEYDMETEIGVWITEMQQTYDDINQWADKVSVYDDYVLSGEQFLANYRGYDLRTLTEIYLHHYERGSSATLERRYQWAEYYYRLLTGSVEPIEPDKPSGDDVNPPLTPSTPIPVITRKSNLTFSHSSEMDSADVF